MKVNLAYLKEHAPSVVTPLVITNLGDQTLTVEKTSSVEPSQRIMKVK